MKLSVIVTSFLRPHLLQWFFTSFKRQVFNCDYEILVLNDGIHDDTEAVCKQFSNDLNIKYIFTGQRNTNSELVWRCPAFALNIGFKKSEGDVVILSCAEMFLLNQCIQPMLDCMETSKRHFVTTDGRNDISGRYLELVTASNGWYDMELYHDPCMVKLDTALPFFMAVKRKEVFAIGGYDEDFTGFAYDDTDFIHRLKRNGLTMSQLVQCKVIHLYHLRDRIGIDRTVQIKYNRNLYQTRINTIIRNQGRNWGCMDHSLRPL